MSSNVRRALLVSCLLGAGVAVSSAQALAQEHQESPTTAEGFQAHGAESEGAHGAHAPEPVNWTNFGCGASDTPGAEGFAAAEHGAGEPASGEHAAAQGAAHAHEAPPPFIASLFNFAILGLILYMAVRRMANPALEDRRAAVEAELNEAQRLRAEAERLHAEYNERLEKMDAEFAQLREEFVKAGQAEVARIKSDAAAKAERMEQEGSATIEQEIRQLRSDLLREAVDAAVDTAERAIKNSVNPADQARLADEYLYKLETAAKSGVSV